MFLDLSGVHATRWCSTAYPKNVLGPIRASTSDLEALTRPEECSWSYLAVALHSHREPRRPEKYSWSYFRGRSARWPPTMQTGIMFPDLSETSSQLIESCSTRKIFLELSEVAWDRCAPGSLKERATDPTSPESSACSESHLKTGEFRQHNKGIHPQRQSFRD
jgi:hypothetical protein